MGDVARITDPWSSLVREGYVDPLAVPPEPEVYGPDDDADTDDEIAQAEAAAAKVATVEAVDAAGAASAAATEAAAAQPAEPAAPS